MLGVDSTPVPTPRIPHQGGPLAPNQKPHSFLEPELESSCASKGISPHLSEPWFHSAAKGQYSLLCPPCMPPAGQGQAEKGSMERPPSQNLEIDLWAEQFGNKVWLQMDGQWGSSKGTPADSPLTGAPGASQNCVLES